MSTPLTLADIRVACNGELPLPPAGREAPFDEPWQAQAFAMTVLLHERGTFTWPEWAATLTRHIQLAQTAGDADDGLTYYGHWLAALEDIVCRQGLGTADQLHRLGEAWHAAAEQTPHGQPITLANPPTHTLGLL